LDESRFTMAQRNRLKVPSKMKGQPAWEAIFPSTDLCEHLKTRRLLDAWYLLASKNVAALIDTVKPRLFKVFTFGKFGTLQQLLIDVDCFQEAGRGGMRVVYHKDGKKYTPFKDRPYVFEDTPSEAITFDTDSNSVAIVGIQCYDADLNPAEGTMDLQVAVSGDDIEFIYKAPVDAEMSEVEVELYPLYTDYKGRSWNRYEVVDYYCWESRYHNPKGRFEESAGEYLELRDRHGRVPTLTVSAPNMEIGLVAFCDPTRNDAHRLRLTLKGPSSGKALFTLKQNPVTVHTVPIIPADKPHAITIASAQKPSVKMADRSFPVRRLSRGRWSSIINVPHGVNHLLVESPEGVSDRLIAAVGDIHKWVEKIGIAASKSLWTEGTIAGLMPQVIDVKRLIGKVRGPHGRSQRSIAYCSHNPRALMIIVAAALQAGDRDLLERAWISIKAMVRLAYKHEDGALVLPIYIYPDGTAGAIDATRPSDPVIAIRSILMTRSAFLRWGDYDRAEEALGYARGFALALLRMAGPKGQLEARYRYPTLEVTHRAQIQGRGTVNNWVTNVWDLAEILYLRKDPLAEKLKALCHEHADLLIKSRPSVLRLTGGGEDGPNNSDALNSAAGFFLVKRLASGEKLWERRAKEAFLMAALNNTIVHIDQPQNFFFTFDWTESIWHDGPLNVQSKGGMHDLTSCDVGLAIAHHLRDTFALKICAYQFLSRLVDGVYENGAVLNRVTAMPNFQYVKTDFTESLNFGAVGAFAFYKVCDFHRLPEQEEKYK